MNFFSNKYLNILITYGSQTGNAETISEILYKNLIKFIVTIKRTELNNIEIKDFNNYDYIIIILSTTGDGDFPDNSNKFWRRMRRYKEKDLDKMNYILLGLGSTDYSNFCFSSKSLERRLLKNKAKKSMETKFADDAVGLEDVVDPWLQDVEDFLRKKQKDIQNWFVRNMTKN